MGKVISGFLAAAVIVFATLAPQLAMAEDEASDWSGREVIAAHIEKIGGESAIKKIESYHMVGKYLNPASSLEADLDVKYARPNRMLVVADLGSTGSQRRGYDGKIGWSIGIHGRAQLLDGDELNNAKRDAATGLNLLPSMQAYAGATVVGKTKFADQMCQQVDVVLYGETYKEYYSQETGLLVGRTEMIYTPQGPTQLTITLSDYKDFDGLLIATTLSHEVSGMEWMVKYSSFEANTVEPGVFDLPDEVKSIVE